MSSINKTKYYVGIDLGYKSATISYFDIINNEPITYDITGGYGNTNIPVCMQYIYDEDIWITGEDAQLTYGDGVIVKNLLDKLEKNYVLYLRDKKIKIEKLIEIFIHKLILHFYNLNPNANVVSITVSVPNNIYPFFKEKIKLKKYNINIVNSIKSIVEYLNYYNMLKGGNYVLMDYGYDEFRTYLIKQIDCEITVTPYIINKKISGRYIEELIYNELLKTFKNQINSLQDSYIDNIQQMVDEYIPLIFQKYDLNESVRIYFNFIFPPFRGDISNEVIKDMLNKTENIFHNIINKCINNEKNKFILVGNGFKMNWTQKKFNSKSNTIFGYKDNIISKGTCLLSAKELTKTGYINIKIQGIADKSYGVMVKTKEGLDFLPIVPIGGKLEGNSKVIIIRKHEQNPILKIYSKDIYDNIKEEQKVNIDFMEDLSRVEISLKFDNDMNCKVNIKDLPL